MQEAGNLCLLVPGKVDVELQEWGSLWEHGCPPAPPGELP